MRLARLLASGVATSCGLPLEEVEDFRVVVDEVCATLVEAGGGNPIRVEFTIRGNQLLVDGSTRESPGNGLDEDRLSLSQQILDVVTMAHSFSRQDGHVHFSAATLLRGGGVG
jgi:anti-sigma regulatory factor (Ser/Thr protein kinase)